MLSRRKTIAQVMGVLASCVLYPHLAPAQSHEWPAIPHLELDDNFSPEEKQYALGCAPYFSLTDKGYDYLPLDQLWSTPGLGARALEEYSFPKGFQGLLALAPLQSNPEGKEYVCLSLKHLGDQTGWPHPQVFYRKVANNPCLYSPSLSPNGKTMLLWDGDPSMPGGNLVIWDIYRARFRLIPDWFFRSQHPQAFETPAYINTPALRWSPGSRFCSYLRSEDDGADAGGNMYPASLCVLDSQSRQERGVIKDWGSSWSWTYDGKLLGSRILVGWNANVTARLSRPSVYIADPNQVARSQRSHKLFDGGYYASASPDGRWIAFCDWPGDLLEAPQAPAKLANNSKRGLFLFDVRTRQRQFVGEMSLKSRGDGIDDPLMQWSPDSQKLYVLETDTNPQLNDTTAIIRQLNLRERVLKPLMTIDFHPQLSFGYYKPHGISPDGKRLYYEFNEFINGPDSRTNNQFTLFSIDTSNGVEKVLLRLKNIGGENPGWDFLDQSRPNPAQLAAERLENRLPVWKSVTVPKFKK